MIDLHAPDANEITWLSAGDEAILSALNEMPPYPNPDFLRWVRVNRPELLEAARFALHATGEWRREMKPYDDEIRRLFEP